MAKFQAEGASPRADRARARKGLNATIVKRESLREFHIILECLPGDSIPALVERLHAFVSGNHARIVRE